MKKPITNGVIGIIVTISIGIGYAFADSTEPVITVKMNGPSIFYLDESNQIIRATVEIQNYTPSDGIYFMKVTHLPTQKVMKDFDIYPKASGNDLWSVQIAYPFLESDIKVGDQTLFGEFEIHIRTEKGSQTASTKFSIFESSSESEPKPVPSESSTDSDHISENVPEWIKTTAGWWAEGNIDDSDFIDGLSYLIHEGIVVTNIEPIPKTEQQIPEWVKTNSGWWAEGNIDDLDFLSGIEYMALQGTLGTGIQKQVKIADIMEVNKESTDQGVIITWTNTDSKAHTVTSGNPITGLSGVFDSSLFMAGTTFSHIFTDAGSFDYFCMVHPWESGTIAVNTDDLKIYYEELEKQKLIEQQELEKQKLIEQQELEKQKLIEQQKQADILRNEDANDIKNQFEASIIEILSEEITEKDVEDFRDFIGEERYQKQQEINAKIESKYPELVVDFGPELATLVGIDIGLTFEEEFFLLELTEQWFEFFKQEMSERIIQIDKSFDEAKRQINELELSDEEKFQHIKDMEEKKTAYVSGAVSGMKNLILLEDEIVERKRELQLESELHGKPLESDSSICGEGTIMKNGKCVVDSTLGGGCLIATATYGSELAPQVQQLRELRDSKLLQTESGSAFMESFNDFYYSFSPIIADYERENPVFKDFVKLVITPMISSLSILNHVDMETEAEVLGYGISLILLNVGMYVGVPAIVIVGIRKKF